MKALEHQFGRQKESLHNDIDRFTKSQRKTGQQIRDFERRLNGLNKILIQMKGLFSKLKDSKDKKSVITNSEEQIKTLSTLIKQTNNDFDQMTQNKLFQGASSNNSSNVAAAKTKISNTNLMKDNLAGAKAFTKDVYDLQDQTNNINLQLIDDNQMIDKINNVRDQIDADVATTSKLTKIQKNQELLKRLTLIGLAIFLTISDVILLILKIK